MKKDITTKEIWGWFIGLQIIFGLISTGIVHVQSIVGSYEYHPVMIYLGLGFMAFIVWILITMQISMSKGDKWHRYDNRCWQWKNRVVRDKSKLSTDFNPSERRQNENMSNKRS